MIAPARLATPRARTTTHAALAGVPPQPKKPKTPPDFGVSTGVCIVVDGVATAIWTRPAGAEPGRKAPTWPVPLGVDGAPLAPPPPLLQADEEEAPLADHAARVRHAPAASSVTSSSVRAAVEAIRALISRFLAARSRSSASLRARDAAATSERAKPAASSVMSWSVREAVDWTISWFWVACRFSSKRCVAGGDGRWEEGCEMRGEIRREARKEWEGR